MAGRAIWILSILFITSIIVQQMASIFGTSHIELTGIVSNNYIFTVTHVLHMDTTIRNIDDLLYKKLKIKAAQEGLSIGEAINRALSQWMKPENKTKRSILEIRPEHFGYNNRNLSEDHDNILYNEDAV